MLKSTKASIMIWRWSVSLLVNLTNLIPIANYQAYLYVMIATYTPKTREIPSDGLWL